MGRMTSFTKEYLFYKAMMFAEENGIQHITARGLADYCECSTYPIYAHFDSMSRLKQRIQEEIIYRFDQFLRDQRVGELQEVVRLLKDFFSIHDQFYQLIQRSRLDITKLLKPSFCHYVTNQLQITQLYLVELLWLTTIGCCASETVTEDYIQAISLIWDKLMELDGELPKSLTIRLSEPENHRLAGESFR